MKNKITLLSFFFLFFPKNISAQRNYIPNNYFFKSFYSLLFILFIYLGTQAQVYTGDLSLTSQTEVDAFNYTEITGNLTISGSDIRDLSPLLPLISLGGDLVIYNNEVLESLAGLENITSVIGRLLISTNSALTSLVGLENITSVGESLGIYGNAVLTSLTGLENITSVSTSLNFYGNLALTSLTGLENITSVGGRLYISNNSALTSLTGLENITDIDLDLRIEHNPALTGLSGLENMTSIGGYLNITNNSALTSLSGLENLTSLTRYLSISNNAALTSLEGLENITYLTADLSISGNEVLSSLSGLENMTSLIGDLSIFENALLSSLTGLENMTSLTGNLNISSNEVLSSLTGLENITSLTGNLNISGNEVMSSLTGLENITSLTGNLNISGNEVLSSLRGLENMTSVGGNLVISNNAALTSLEGLENMTSLTGGLNIYRNPVLSSFCALYELINIDGLAGSFYVFANVVNPTKQQIIDGGSCSSIFTGDLPLYSQLEVDAFNYTEVTGSLNISGADITDLTPLLSLISIGGYLNIGNNAALTSLTGLENITSVGGDLRVSDNALLSNLTGLKNITSLPGDLNINKNAVLIDLAGLENITSVGGNLNIYYNPVLSSFCILYELINLDGLAGSLNVYYNAVNPTKHQILDGGSCSSIFTGNLPLSSQLEVDAFNYTEVTGGLAISGADITDLTPLLSLTSLGGLSISNNAALTNLTGLENITSLTGYLNISGNEVLSSLSGLEIITSLTGNLNITNNSALTSLTGLENMTSLTGNLTISNNTALTSLKGLENMTSVGGNLRVSNNAELISLAGLENMTSLTGNLIISYNPVLSSFCVLYELINGNGISGTYNVSNNTINPTEQEIIDNGPCNTPPIIDNIIAPVDPIALGNEAQVTVEFTDDNLREGLIDWGDGNVDDAGNITEQTVVWNHTYTAPGVYEVKVKLVDMADEVAEEVYQYIVLYDPSGGFVTGGGWINSPAGAYVDNPLLEGKANFGFVAKYKKGQTVPTGNTEFQFKAGDLKFNSSLFDWLVIAGTKAKFKGVGTINGMGSYGFMISAIDEDSKDKIDKFRIKIWEMANEFVVYDNQNGAEENSDPTTEIQGGAIVVHSGTKKKPDLEKMVLDDSVFIYPNPVSSILNIQSELALKKVEINSILGQPVKEVTTNLNSIELGDLSNGIYIIRVQSEKGTTVRKLIKK